MKKLVGAFPVLHPLTVTLLQVPADGLDVAAVVADGELLALGLEQDDFYLMACAFLAYHLIQPYHSR